jgi:hypothetical protein
MTIPAHLPLEEALEYYSAYRDNFVRSVSRTTRAITIGGYADYVLGICPIRKSTSMWLIDTQGQFWTNQTWHDQGRITECWDNEETFSQGWPLPLDEHVDFSLLISFLNRRAYRWGVESTVSLAEFDDVCLGLDTPDRESLRALVIFRFDQEYGIGAFAHSTLAARRKHRRTITRIRQRERLVV